MNRPLPIREASAQPGRIVPFFVLAYAITWFGQVPYVARMHGVAVPASIIMPPLVIAAVGPALAALLLSAHRFGGQGARALLSRTDPSRRVLPWILPALLVPAVLHLGATALFDAAGGDAPLRLYAPMTAEAIGIAILAPPGEEIGWRGYAFPRLQARLGPLQASLLLGLLHWLWHLPWMLLPGSTLAEQLGMGVFVVGINVIFTFLYNGSGGSVLIAILAHLGIHLDAVGRARAAGDGLTPVWLTAVAIVLAAAILVWRRPDLGMRAATSRLDDGAGAGPST